MMASAEARESHLSKRPLKKCEDHAEIVPSADSKPVFLSYVDVFLRVDVVALLISVLCRTMRSSVYMEGDQDMGDRLRRNKHYVQRDSDASTFLKRG